MQINLDKNLVTGIDKFQGVYDYFCIIIFADLQGNSKSAVNVK